MPFGQQAFTESLGSTPAILEVQASTVGDFFSSTGSAGQASSILAVDTVNRERLDSNNKEITDEQKKTNPNDKRIAELNSNANSVTNDLAKTPYLVGSYAAAINSYQTQLAAGGHLRHAEVYQFDIHPDLAKSKIVRGLLLFSLTATSYVCLLPVGLVFRRKRALYLVFKLT